MTTFSAPYMEICLQSFCGGNGTYATNSGSGPGAIQAGIVGVGVYVTQQGVDCPQPSLPSASLGNLGGVNWEDALLAATYPGGSPVNSDQWSILGLQVPSVWPA